MIIITANHGILRIRAEIPIPSAPAGQWDPARIGKLMQTIEDTANAAEMVDSLPDLPNQAKPVVDSRR